jgi:hypothetical protein
MPFAVDDRKIDPRIDSAAITTTASTSPTPGPMTRSGHQSPVIPVIRTAAVYTKAT